MGWFTAKSVLPNWPTDVPTFLPIGTSVAQSRAPGLKLSLAASIEEWRSRGIEADRQGCPDLMTQIQSACHQKIDAIVCSALDGDPRLRLNAAVAARFANQVAVGMITLAQLTGVRRSWIVVEAGSPPPWLQPLREAGLEVIELPNHYPQADPTLLVYTLLGRRLKPGRLPTEQGVILLDAPAALTLANGTMDSVPLGVLDHESGRTAYLEAPAGTPWMTVVQAGGFAAEGMELIGGDLPRELGFSPQTAIGSGELTLHIRRRVRRPDPQPCVRCGWCQEVCPTGVSPALLLEAVQRGDAALARAAGRDACIECGLCDQICPSNLPLLAAANISAGCETI